MSIGLISENKIREKLRKELNEDIKKFLDNGGEIKRYDLDERNFEPDYNGRGQHVQQKRPSVRK
jgi:hypothetical protein